MKTENHQRPFNITTDSMRPYADPDHLGNSPEYHTGEPCVERGCARPAGTVWSPY